MSCPFIADHSASSEVIKDENTENNSNIDFDLASAVCSIHQACTIDGDIDVILDKAVSVLKNLYNPDIVEIYISNKRDSKYFKDISDLHKSGFSMSDSEIVSDRSRGIAELSIANKKLIVISDCSDLPRFNSSYDRLSNTTTRNIICSPIELENSVIGVVFLINIPQLQSFKDDVDSLKVENNDSGSLKYEPVDLIKSFELLIKSLSTALTQSYQLIKSRLNNQRSQSILAILRTRSLDHSSLDKLLQVTIDAIDLSMSCPQLVSIYLCDHTRKEIFICASKDGMEGLTISYGQGIAGYVAQTMETIRLDDAYEDSRFLHTVDEYTGSCTQSVLCVPVPAFANDSSAIALIQVINKRILCTSHQNSFTDTSYNSHNNNSLYTNFSEYDEETLKLIAKELAIGLRMRAKELYVLKYNNSSANTTRYSASTTMDNGHSEKKAEVTTPIENTRMLQQRLSHVSLASLEYSLLQDYASTAYRYKYRVINDKLIRGAMIPISNPSTHTASTTRSRSSTSSDTMSSDSVFSSNDNTTTENIRSTCDENDNNYANDFTLQITPQSTLTLKIPIVNSSLIADNNCIGRFTVEEADAAINDYNFDPFVTNDDDLIALSMHMFRSYNLLETFSIKPAILHRFLVVIHGLYHVDNPFHNFKHGWSVMHLTYNILRQGCADEYLTSLDILAILVAAICHDVDHTGYSNGFEISTRSLLAVLYSNDSVLERHHAATTNRVLNNFESQFGFLNNLSLQDKQDFRKLIIEAIFATDMSKHFETVDRLITRSALEPHEMFDKNDVESRIELCKYVLHSADIGAQTQTNQLAMKWTNYCIQEFSNQADKEIELGVEPTSYMIGLRGNDTKCMRLQFGFVDGVVLPLWSALAKCFPKLTPSIDRLMVNKKYYADKCEVRL